jgi:hypothetical protein
MRGWLVKAAICAALLSAPAWAQRGGGFGGSGHMGGGHAMGGHVGVSPGFAGHAGAPAGFHSSIGYARVPPAGPRAWGNGWRGNGWHGNGNWGSHGNNWWWRGNGWWWRGNRFRFWGGYPWWAWNWGWGWYPWTYGYGYGYDDLGYDSPDYSPSYYPTESYAPPGYGSDGYGPPYDSSYGDYASLPPSGSSASYASEAEVQRIQNEVEQLKAQQADRYSEPKSNTVLVYRDGHSETVENYAVSDGTVWIFNQHRTRKVPLSQIDVAATQRDNEARGGEFIVPDTH